MLSLSVGLCGNAVDHLVRVGMNVLEMIALKKKKQIDIVIISKNTSYR